MEVVVSERVDRNGTKHQVVETECDRCGGVGGHRIWTHTGYTCFKCGGSGRMQVKRKIYTPEYRAKLDARNEKRWQKKMEEKRKQAEKTNKARLEKWGYGQDKIYFVIGNTYLFRERLKEEGARFNDQVMGWFFTEKPDNWETVELEVSELVFYDQLTGEVHMYHHQDVKDYIESKTKVVGKESRHVGQIGDKVEVELSLERSFWVEFSSYRGFGTDRTCINIMKDSDGNVFVWKTGRNLENDVNENGNIKIKGTIKEHTEYQGVKQTVLTRCRVIK